MSQHFTRRGFLATGAAFATATALPFVRAQAAATPIDLTIGTRTLEVNGKAATVYGITQPTGTPGVIVEAGARFAARLTNATAEPHLIHWHGQTPPLAQDGVPGLSQEPLAPGAAQTYDFAPRPGTHWMHSHHGLAEQRLMAAPLIVRENAMADEQDVVVLLHDFTFRDPGEILAGLGGGAGGHGAHGAMSAPAMPADPHAGHSMGNMGDMGNMGGMMGGAMGMMTHLHDVEYDAFLANDRTLDDPQVTRVEAGGRVRLRLINGATATAFQIDLGALEGRVVAVDGNAVHPVPGRRFPIAMGQRLDIRLDIPKDGGAFPVVAVREGEAARTGVILATPKARVAKLALAHDEGVQPVGLELEARLKALAPLPAREPDRRIDMALGEAPGYRWTLNGRAYGDHAPLTVKRGERVLLTIRNFTSMMHPMHLHGHHFQVVALNDVPLSGAVRDTVIVPGHMGSATVAFDADNPGEWVLHCHNLYHMAAGMMTTVRYAA